jgi:hypothetical protein
VTLSGTQGVQALQGAVFNNHGLLYRSSVKLAWTLRSL